jgi:hypothetical protein
MGARILARTPGGDGAPPSTAETEYGETVMT